MDRRALYAQALREAAYTLGSEARLAAFLQVTPAQLRGWLAGTASVPLEMYLLGLDVIADHPRALHGRAATYDRIRRNVGRTFRLVEKASEAIAKARAAQDRARRTRASILSTVRS
jgi:hypothetical protein